MNEHVESYEQGEALQLRHHLTVGHAVTGTDQAVMGRLMDFHRVVHDYYETSELIAAVSNVTEDDRGFRMDVEWLAPGEELPLIALRHCVRCEWCGNSVDPTICGLCFKASCASCGPCPECYYPLSEDELRETAWRILRVAEVFRKRQHLPTGTHLFVDLPSSGFRAHYSAAERAVIRGWLDPAVVSVFGWLP